MIQEIFRLYAERSSFFAELILQHIRIAGISVTVSLVLGLVIGVIISEYRKPAQIIMNVINVLYTIPSISMLGFLIPFTGIGDKTAIIALSIYGLLPIVRNTYTGISTIQPFLTEVATGMGSTRGQVLFRVKLPLALPVILAGVRSMVVMTISLSGIASYIGAGGLGVAIYRGITTNNAAMTYAGSILIALVALISDRLIYLLEKKIPWGETARKRREQGAMSVISLKNITAAYGNKDVLMHFNLEIARGEFVMLIGTSGCGKTTALKLMNGLLRPKEGSVVVNGNDLSRTDLTALRRNLGYVVQETGLFPHLTIEKNISYVADLSRKKDSKAIQNRVTQLLQLVELPEEIRRRYPDELSGGQKQRVGIARALMNSPEILLMDEPFGAVDEITRRRLQEEIGKIHRQQGETIVFVTHDIDEALRLGTRIVVMDAGRIIQDGTPEEIREHPATDFVKKLMSER